MNHVLPYDKLVAFQVAKQLLGAVVSAKLSDAELRDQATRAAKSVVLNVAEASGRAGAKDRQRVFAIARGECVEAAAAFEVAAMVGACTEAVAVEVRAIAARLHAILSALCR